MDQRRVKRIKHGHIDSEDVPEFPGQIIEKIDQYQNTRSANFLSWLNDAEDSPMLMATRFGNSSQIHRIDNPYGCRSQLTFFTEPVANATVCTDYSNQCFLFLKDIGGNENHQIYLYDLKTATYKLITDGTSKNSSVKWDRIGSQIAFSSNLRNNKDRDVVIMDVKTGNRRNLVCKLGYWIPLDWSPDNKFLLVQNYISANDSKIYIVCTETGFCNPLHPTEDKVAFGNARWSTSEETSKNGYAVYYTSDIASEFHELYYREITQNGIPTEEDPQCLTRSIPWNITGISVSRKGKYLVFRTNEDGYGKFYLLNMKMQDYKVIPSPEGVIQGCGFHPNGKKIALTVTTPQTPGDIYVCDVSSLYLTRWTQSEVGGLNTANFINPNLIKYETFDCISNNSRKKRQIPCFVYKPKVSKVKHPVVIRIHGGPEGQSRPRFNSMFQFMIQKLGVAILDPNVRGSSGYGKEYLLLDNGRKREDSVKDIGYLIKWIKTQDDLDSSRIVVWGGSYGGYMVLASMIHFGDELLGGIDMVGISNFVTFLENTQPYRQDLRRVEYGDERDPDMREFLLKISPTTNANKITRPMLIGQGLNDPRVPVTESEQIRDCLRNNGVPVWYIVADNEGHGFRKKENVDYYRSSIAMFLIQRMQLNIE